MTQYKKYLIIGQGDIGLAVTNQLATQDICVTGLARKQRNHYALNENANFLQVDAKTLQAEQLQHFDCIAVIVSPDTHSATGYQNSYLAICQHLASLAPQLPNLQRIVFISSTGVYGQDAGEWIDETVSPLTPKSETSQYLLQAEQVLQQAFGDKTVIVRPSGIYGVERIMRIKKAYDAHKQPLPISQWTNRIMDTDLVNIIANVLTIQAVKPLYLATDYAPVTLFELTTWLCKELEITTPEMGNTQTVTGKRLHSNIPRQWLTYPDWQVGYQHILQYL